MVSDPFLELGLAEHSKVCAGSEQSLPSCAEEGAALMAQRSALLTATGRILKSSSVGMGMWEMNCQNLEDEMSASDLH